MVRQKSSERKDRHEQFKCVSHLNCGPTNSARHLPVGLVGFGFVARVVRLILIEFGAKRMNFGPLLSLVWNRGRKLSVAFSSCFLERKRAREGERGQLSPTSLRISRNAPSEAYKLYNSSASHNRQPDDLSPTSGAVASVVRELEGDGNEILPVVALANV